MAVLMVMTNVDHLGRDPEIQCGWYLPGMVYPYHALKKAGIEMVWTSPLGGNAPVDIESVGIWDHPICENTVEDESVMALFKKTVAIRDIDASKFKGIYFVGGHGSMFDCANNEKMNQITAQIYENGGFVAGDSHGLAGLLGVKLSNGKKLVDGVKLTAFPNKEVERLNFRAEGCPPAYFAYAFPFSLEDKLIEEGAIFSSGPPVREHMVTDGRIITGQNPKSVEMGMGPALVEAYKACSK